MNGKVIFIAPLDWGLGHATRCVPLIKQLMLHNTVIIGTTSITETVLKEEFPDLKHIAIEPYRISYSAQLPLWLKLAFDAPRILSVISKEHKQLQKIITTHNIDVVISDNRFGLYNSGVKSIYITHQLHIKAGFFSGIASNIHQRYMHHFDEVWIPDYEDRKKSLAGDLSAPLTGKTVRYLGPQSRLIQQEEEIMEFDYLCLLSGPEPQRTLFEKELAQLFNQSSKRICIVRGTQCTSENIFPPHIRVIDLADAKTLSGFISRSQTVICRSGYSTLMDLHIMGHKHCLLVPTPGQSEQQYLADYWEQHFGSKTCTQNDLKNVRLP